jgi:D-sedoheptulose 7-phosphate isomerase
MEHVEEYFSEVARIAELIDKQKIESFANALRTTRDISNGRVFVLGVGGSAGNASHMVNDLRKLCGIEAYAPTDNVSELTARTNDEGFDTVFIEYLRTSRFTQGDTIIVLSVGGGSVERNVSVGLIKAIDYAHKMEGCILSIVGKEDGYAATKSDLAVVVPPVNPDRVTPHSEAFQAVVWHCVVSHPDLQLRKTKW